MAVGQLPDGNGAARQRDDKGRDDPLHLRDVGLQRRLDHGDRGVDDGEIDAAQKAGDGDTGHGQPALAV
ncbi:hypothetical protein D3C71_1654180 [compost metagenome]